MLYVNCDIKGKFYNGIVGICHFPIQQSMMEE